MDKTVGRYTLKHRLGVGGMAEVWLAEQSGPRGFVRKTVVKRIHPHLSAEEDFVTSFEDEARLAAKLHHPGIVRVEDFGDDDGVLYMALEYVDGDDLSKLMRHGRNRTEPLPLNLILQVGVDIAEALAYAHDLCDDEGQPLNIVHRDVSPQNILVQRGTGRAKLLDFGIARSEANLHKTRAGMLKGKVAYFSPEQARGEPLDGRSDQYALGVLLYEALAGERAITGGSVVTQLSKAANADFKALTDVAPNVPEGVHAVIERALALEVEGRFSTCAQMAKALDACLAQHGGRMAPGDYAAWIAEIHRAATASQAQLADVEISDSLSTFNNSGDSKRTSGLAVSNLPEAAEASGSTPEVAAATLFRLSSEAETLLADSAEIDISGDEPTLLHPEGLRVSGAPEPAASNAVATHPPSGFVADRSAWIVGLLFAVMLALAGTSVWMTLRGDDPDDVILAAIPEAVIDPPSDSRPAPVDSVAAVADLVSAVADPVAAVADPVPVVADPVAAVADPVPVVADPVRGKQKRQGRPKKSFVKTPAVASGSPGRSDLPRTLNQRDLDALTFASIQRLRQCKQSMGATGGNVTVRLKIHENGMVFGVRVSGAPPEVARCLKGVVRKWRYPKHRGGTAQPHSFSL
jgi:serine/threonine protein kinase